MNEERQSSEMDSAETLVRRLLDTGLVQANDLCPCSDADIRHLESTYNLRLPESYKQFLRRLGRGAGSFLQNRDGFAFYDAVLEMTAVFQEGFGDRVSVPEQWFCFAVLHKGDTFLFLPADGSDDDPPVYAWSEEWSEEEKLEECYASFWDWFADEVKHDEELRARSDGAE